MKFVSYLNEKNEERLGLYLNAQTFDLAQTASALSLSLPNTMNVFLEGGEAFMKRAQQVELALKEGTTKAVVAQVSRPLAPVPHPPTCRDAYAFRQHVQSMRRSRGMDMIPEFDQFPIFYYTNHHAISGEGEIQVEADHLHRLDFELELAIVIGKRGKNVSSQEADSYIAGFTIMNDFSARLLQTEEMKLSLGPAKGKDFVTTIGPWLVTPDELTQYRIPGPFGDRYRLEMKAFHNGKQVSLGNAKDMDWTFAEVIERCAYGTEIFPGDVIGSGTVGTGCYSELNATGEMKAKEKGESFTSTWLKPGDSIDLEITGLGTLKNTVTSNPGKHSILAKKKNVQ